MIEIVEPTSRRGDRNMNNDDDDLIDPDGIAGFGSLASGGLNAVTMEYKNDPSIENYVRLRRSDPDAEIEVSVIGGFEAMFYMRDELERYGIDPDLLGGILDANVKAIEEISLRIMELITEAKALERTGETQIVSRGRAIPDKLIDWVICCSLDALSWNDELTIPRDLIVLIRERLGGPNPQYEQEGQIRKSKSDAAIIAGQLKARGITPTFKIVGGALKVAPSTVMRWFGPGEFERERDRWAALCDENGNLRPLRRSKE
jgi:hypothetical protein